MDLIIGDLHVQPSNLTDTRTLLDFIVTVYQQNNCKNMIFLGDIFHTHAVIRQEVAHFLRDYFKNTLLPAVNYDKNKIILVPGNHDAISPVNSNKNALSLLLDEFAQIVSTESFNEGLLLYEDGYAFLPFIYDPHLFINRANVLYESLLARNISHPILFCHQTFDGAVYETGAPCESGINSDLLSYNLIISGHIHTYQSLKNKVLYIGTPRHITAGEANQKKYIFLLNKINIDNNIKYELYPIETTHLTKNYRIIEICQENLTINSLDEDIGQVIDITANLLKDTKELDDVRIRLIGTKVFITKVSQAIQKRYPHVKLLFKYTDANFVNTNIQLETHNELALDKAIYTYLDHVLKINDPQQQQKIISEMRNLGL